jgi:hypothetical protein
MMVARYRGEPLQTISDQVMLALDDNRVFRKVPERLKQTD